jgi:hypothetical protein
MAGTGIERDDDPYAPPASSLDAPPARPFSGSDKGTLPPLAGRARRALLFLRIWSIVSCVGLLGTLVERGRTSETGETAWLVYGCIGFPLGLASVLTYFLWLHRAVLRLGLAGAPISASPAWAVGSWFVPLVQFVVPYRTIRDLWRTSGAARAPSIVAWWWSSWLASFVATASYALLEGISGVVFLPRALSFAVDALSSLLPIVETLFSIRIVGEITRAQARWLGDGAAP